MKLQTVKINRNGLPVVINLSDYRSDIDTLWDNQSKDETPNNDPNRSMLDGSGSLDTQTTEKTVIPGAPKESKPDKPKDATKGFPKTTIKKRSVTSK